VNNDPVVPSEKPTEQDDPFMARREHLQSGWQDVQSSENISVQPQAQPSGSANMQQQIDAMLNGTGAATSGGTIHSAEGLVVEVRGTSIPESTAEQAIADSGVSQVNVVGAGLQDSGVVAGGATPLSEPVDIQPQQSIPQGATPRRSFAGRSRARPEMQQQEVFVIPQPTQKPGFFARVRWNKRYTTVAIALGVVVLAIGAIVLINERTRTLHFNTEEATVALTRLQSLVRASRDDLQALQYDGVMGFDGASDALVAARYSMDALSKKMLYIEGKRGVRGNEVFNTQFTKLRQDLVTLINDFNQILDKHNEFYVAFIQPGLVLWEYFAISISTGTVIQPATSHTLNQTAQDLLNSDNPIIASLAREMAEILEEHANILTKFSNIGCAPDNYWIEACEILWDRYEYILSKNSELSISSRILQGLEIWFDERAAAAESLIYRIYEVVDLL